MIPSHDTHQSVTVLVDRARGRGPGRGIMLASARGVTAETVNLMARYGRGLISACVTAERAMDLALRPMPEAVSRPGMPRFLVSVEAAACTETGISAAERALTLRVLADPSSTPADIHMPGHIMPCLPPPGSPSSLVATALNYATSHSGSPVAAWCDILDDTGELGSADYCLDLAGRLGMTAFHLEILQQILALGPAGSAIGSARLRAAERSTSLPEAPLAGAIYADPMLSGLR